MKDNDKQYKFEVVPSYNRFIDGVSFVDGSPTYLVIELPYGYINADSKYKQRSIIRAEFDSKELADEYANKLRNE